MRLTAPAAFYGFVKLLQFLACLSYTQEIFGSTLTTGSLWRKKFENPKLDSESYINRELSVLAFNQRVLALAQNTSIPLLERIKFLAIVGNNLDEFFMVRVSSYVQKFNLGLSSTRPDGYTPAALLAEIRHNASDLMHEQRQTIAETLVMLKQEGLFVLSVAELEPEEREAVRTYFSEEIFPILTPLAADYARPFPFISNLSLNIGVYLEREHKDDHNNHQSLEFVRVKSAPKPCRVSSM